MAIRSGAQASHRVREELLQFCQPQKQQSRLPHRDLAGLPLFTVCHTGQPLLEQKDEGVEEALAAFRRQAEMQFLESFDIQEESIVQVMSSLKLGKAGGDDAVLAELLRALSPEQRLRLGDVLNSVLRGTHAISPIWRSACVSLIPKGSNAVLPGHFRP